MTSLPFLARLAPLIAALFLTAAQGPGPSRLFPVDLYQRLGARPMAGWTRYRWFDG